MEVSKGEIISAGVDWITCTAKREGNARHLQAIAEKLLFQEQMAGCEMREHSFEGYRMLSSGGVAGGWRDDGVILRLSSHLARENWYPALKAAESVSRLDLQTTIRYTPERPNLATHLEARARKYKREHNHKTEIELRRNDVKGSTLYTGQRTSYRYGRLYDKHRESKDDFYKGCWRAEVELHKKEARYVAGQLLSTQDAEMMKVAYVSKYYRRLGILLPSHDRCMTWEFEPRPTVDRSLARTLSWYRTQLQPSIRMTVACAGVDVVLDALGLTDLVSARTEPILEGGEK